MPGCRFGKVCPKLAQMLQFIGPPHDAACMNSVHVSDDSCNIPHRNRPFTAMLLMAMSWSGRLGSLRSGLLLKLWAILSVWAFAPLTFCPTCGIYTSNARTQHLRRAVDGEDVWEPEAGSKWKQGCGGEQADSCLSNSFFELPLSLTFCAKFDKPIDTFFPDTSAGASV